MWPDFNFDFITGNKVLEAEYQDWTASIASKETSEDNRPLVMAEGEFYPGAKLYLSVNGEGYQVSLTNSMEETKQEYTGQVILRVLCEDVDNAVVQVETDGNWQEVESTVIGSYRQFTMDVPGQPPGGSGRGQPYENDYPVRCRRSRGSAVDYPSRKESGEEKEEAERGRAAGEGGRAERGWRTYLIDKRNMVEMPCSAYFCCEERKAEI